MNCDYCDKKLRKGYIRFKHYRVHKACLKKLERRLARLKGKTAIYPLFRDSKVTKTIRKAKRWLKK